MIAKDLERCARCSRVRAQDSPAEALAWVAERDDGRQTWLCPSCARQHVRDIESRLPAEHWA